MKKASETLHVSYQDEDARGPVIVVTWAGQTMVLPAEVAAAAVELIENALEVPRLMGQVSKR